MQRIPAQAASTASTDFCTISTATIGAVLGVMGTHPAARFRAVARECLLAVLVAVTAAFAANAYDARVSGLVGADLWQASLPR